MATPSGRLVIASCSNLPDWEVDDQPFHKALGAQGTPYEIHPWDAQVDWSAFAACLIRTTWDYDERREEFVAWSEQVEKETKLLNPAHIIRWNTDKPTSRSSSSAACPSRQRCSSKPVAR